MTRTRTATLGVLLILLLVAVSASGSGTYRPPLPTRTNKAFLVGEKLWRSKKIVARGGETCAGCHDSARGPELERIQLQRKVEDLPKLVYYEIVTRSKNTVLTPDSSEVQALVTYLQERFRLVEESLPVDDPHARIEVQTARSLYLQGDYGGSTQILREVMTLAISPELSAEAHILLGSIYQILGKDAEAVAEFSEVFRLFPDAQIDAEIFSPKTVALFEVVRRAVVGGQS